MQNAASPEELNDAALASFVESQIASVARQAAAQVEAQIAEVAQQAAHAAETAPSLAPRRVPWRPLNSHRVLIVTWALCIGLTVVNLEFGGLFAPRALPLDPLELINGLQTSAAMDAVLIEAYRSEHGSLPFSLADVGLPENDPALEYQRSGDQAYRVIARHGRYEGVYDSQRADTRRAAAAEARAARAARHEAEKEARIADNMLMLSESQDRAEAYRRARGDFDGDNFQ